tara:strand:+ start:192111 stop:193136 length:1026 start_codon:yes stop_codon:yes gene_type:complete
VLNKKKKYNIAVIGATGLVGNSLLEILFARKFPIHQLHAVASNKSIGTKVKFGETLVETQSIESFDFNNIDIAFFSAGSDVSDKYVPLAAKSNCVVIDNTSRFRYEDNIPLIIPEVNAHEIKNYKDTNIIANPNCSTIQMLVALKPIHDRYEIKDIVVSTYQAVSGSGRKGMMELSNQIDSFVNGKEINNNVYPTQIAFNVIPFVDSYHDNNYTKEEMKMIWETKKILSKKINVNPTAVRVPVMIGHSESITIETKKEINIEDVIQDYINCEGLTLMDDVDNIVFPTARSEGSGTDNVYVGRIRKSLSNNNVLNIWVVADNVRKGAALNSIQIAEKLIEEI